MTFYWWSHWFWITLVLSVGLLCRHVHTYPSQEGESLVSSPQPVRTTKLYQTTVSQTWATATQSNIMDLTHRPTTNRPVTPSVTRAQELAELGDVTMSQYDDEEEAAEEEEAAAQQEDRMLLNYQEQDPEQNQKPDTDTEADPNADVDAEEAAVNEKLAQFEFKRSADFTSDQLNNFTNFSSSTSTNDSSSSNTTKPVPISNFNPPAARTTTAKTAAAAAPAVATSPTATAASRKLSPAKSVTAAPAAPAAAATATPSTSTPLGSAAATPSTPKINTEWLSDELLANGANADGEKAPFTLENANKEDELRRAESEHRSRKSKVLSAEYKHINRYINFSSDTKSLLTRSASAAPSASGDGAGLYDATAAAGDEGNISSEALAIQRTYFLDAGAISAICFTVFGVCCTVGTIGIVLYRRRYVNKPQALSEPDSSVYIDDSTMRVSDNSDEMYSLDNDSFLNSLEAMTIQNYWTDTVKHTKL
ncbi:hypothetical protein KR032_003223 [Drosophila birchii]|nr:hypothetical protein KR032_003223 [Drosophila birchii]